MFGLCICLQLDVFDQLPSIVKTHDLGDESEFLVKREAVSEQFIIITILVTALYCKSLL